MKSQEAAFKQSRKPAKKRKIPVQVKAATPQGVKKNQSRNERRKAARKRASLLKAQGAAKRKEDGVRDGQDAASAPGS